MGVRTHIPSTDAMREGDVAGARGGESDAALAAHLRTLSQVSVATLHDLRTPLHTIVLYLELLRGSLTEAPDPDGDRQHERYISVIGSEVQRLERMLESLMAQIRLGGGPEDHFELGAVVQGLLAFLEPYSNRKRVHAHVTVPESPVHVRGERDPVRHSLLQLLMAAMDSAALGTLDVELYAAAQEATVSVVCTSAAPSEASEDPFALGHRAKPEEAERSLFLARSAVERQGGRVRIETWDEERGARFTLNLPLYAERR